MPVSPEHADGMLQYISDHYPFILVVLTTLSGGFMWIKRKVINDVYQTKAEAKEQSDENKAEHTEILNKINENHDEIKDLFISHLGDRHDN